MKTKLTSDMNFSTNYVQQLIAEPMFLHWCQTVFWAFLDDKKDLETKIKNLLNVKHITDLDSNKNALKTFEFYLGRPYLAWFKKRAAGAHSAYQVPVDYLEEDQKKNLQSAHKDIKKHLSAGEAVHTS